MKRYIYTLFLSIACLGAGCGDARYPELAEINLEDMEPYEKSLTPEHPYQLDVTFVNYQTNSYWNHHGTEHHLADKFRLYQAGYFLAYDMGCAIFSASTAFDNVHDPRLGNRSGFEDIECDATSVWYRGNNTESSLSIRAIVPSGSLKREIRFGTFGLGVEYTEARRYCDDAVVWASTLGYLHYFGFPADRLYYHITCEKSLLEFVTLAGTLKFDFGLKNSHRHFTWVYQDPYMSVIRAELMVATFAFNCMQFDVGGFWNVWGRNVGTGVGLICHASATF